MSAALSRVQVDARPAGRCPWSCTRAVARPCSQELELAGEELEPPAHAARQRHGAGPRAWSRSISASREDRSARGTTSSGAVVRLEPVEQVAEEAGVEAQRLDDDVDAVAQRLDHLVGAAAGVVVGGQVPGRVRALEDLVEHLGVVVGHQRQQRRLRAGRDAVVLVDDLHPHLQPRPPGDADVAPCSWPRRGRRAAGCRAGRRWSSAGGRAAWRGGPRAPSSRRARP